MALDPTSELGDLRRGRDASREIDRIIRGAADLEDMLSSVLEAALTIFGCDRAWLLYPCDPEAASWRVPMERTRPKWPGALAAGVDIPMDDNVRPVFSAALAADGCVRFDESGTPVPNEVKEAFSVQAQIIMAVYPKVDSPWMLGLHHCEHAHVWTDAESSIFERMGQRLGDALSSWLTLRDLRQSEKRYRNSFEQAVVGMAVVGVDGRFIRVNPALQQMLGYAPGELEKLSFAAITVESDVQASHALMAALLSGERSSVTFEKQYVHRSGHVLSALVSSRLVRDADGEPLHFATQIQDITALKRAEEDRLHMERQVQHAQKLESLGVLAGGIAHDFNNILVGVLGNASLAKMAVPESSPASLYLDEIELSARRAAELAKHMLAYSGKGQFVISPVALNELVRETDRIVSAMVSKKAQWQFELADDLSPIDADATQIRQVVMNLLINAAEALGDEVGSINVSTAVVEVDEGELIAGRYVLLRVEDTGCGMDEATLEKIFDPFFSTKFTGRGLGLAAVQGIVRGHKGRIRATSRPGVGTTFEVLLPCSTEVRAGKPEPTSDARGDSWRGGGIILIVDDEPAVRKVSRDALTMLGFDVLVASDGAAGVTTFAANADDIVAVVLDLTMPRMSGDEAMKAMERIRAGCAFIISSGYDERSILDRFSDCVPAGFIQKPYTPIELADKLHEVLSGSAAKK